MRTRYLLGILGAATIVAVAACSKPSSEKHETTNGPGPGGAIDTATAKDIFVSRCAACHGANGDGNGPAAAALNPKPRNYHDKEWQKKVTDEELKKAITYGGAAVGKSPNMPGNPDLDAKPEVVEGLVRIVRGFGGS